MLFLYIGYLEIITKDLFIHVEYLWIQQIDRMIGGIWYWWLKCRSSFAVSKVIFPKWQTTLGKIPNQRVQSSLVLSRITVLESSVYIKMMYSDWCGSVGWALYHKLKVPWFDSQSGHNPGLWFSPQMGCIQEAVNRCFSFTSMFLSLPFPLSKNK